MSRKGGEGAQPTKLLAVVQKAADSLFAKCDACAIIAFKQAGAGDADQQVVYVRRGSSVMLNGVLGTLADHGFGGDVSVEIDEPDEGEGEE